MKLRQAHKIARSPRAMEWIDRYVGAVEAGVDPPKPIWNRHTETRVLRRLFRWGTLNRRKDDPS